jgi:hypothetical protein
VRSSRSFPRRSPRTRRRRTSTSRRLPSSRLQTANAATIGEPFNILDNAIDAFDFIASVNGGQRPTRLLTIFWERGSSDGTYYRDIEAPCGSSACRTIRTATTTS